MAQRIRSSYEIKSTTLPVFTYPQSCSNRIEVASGSYGSALSGSSKIMIDEVVPRFHARRAAGEKFFNDMFKEEITVSDVGSGRTTESVANVCTSPTIKSRLRADGAFVASVTPRAAVNSRGHRLPLLSTALSSLEISKLQREVSTEVWSKIGTGSTEMWESVAELRQTISMLNSPVNRLQDLSKRLLQSVSRGNTGRALVKEISDGYLMYRYGVLPLMRDISSMISSLEKEGGEKEVTSRANGQISAHSFSSGAAVGQFTYPWKTEVNDVVTVRGMHLDKGHISIANTFGFDFRGLAMLPLQLTSYSFVADWFSNLSSYVRSTIPAFGWQSLGGCLVTTRVTSTSYTLGTLTNNDPGNITLISGPTGSSSIISVSTTRGSLLDSSFELRSNFGFDRFTRTADALSLIASRFVKVNTLLGVRPTQNSAFHNRKAYQRWLEQPNVS